ncbi:DNA methyltransferase [Geminocystis sp.]|uniref:DNA methyltransferase n=1 Tax=Geminocystis sp. TaxID=2664100 RepID=UPI00359471D3
MQTPLSWNEIKSRAIAFSIEWQNETSENAEAKSFWDNFFNVFGVSRRRVATFEKSVKKLDNKQGFIDLLWKGVILVEHKSKGKNLDKAYQQAIDYFSGLKEYELPKYILVSDFQKFKLYNLDNDQTHEFELKEFVNYVHLFDFIAGYKKQEYKDSDPVNIKAAQLMGELHDRLKEIGYSGHELEVYLVRLLFCLFADDTGIFNKGIFQEYLDLHTKQDGSDLAMHLASVFHILNQSEDKRLKNLDENLAQFPYINGKLFEESLPPASFDSQMREMLLKACSLDWGKISPAIFGSMFQAVMNPNQRRNLGAHYTSEKNIQKVIKPLFLDDLYTEFEKIKNNQNKLKEFHNKIASLTFLDPACGCGNFLIITYRELRDLEILVLKELNKQGQLELDISTIIKVDVDQFFGIEYDEFAVRIAEVAMWLIDHQMNLKVSNEFGQYFVRLPLKKSAKIIHGNALQIDWNSLTLHNSPPFKEGLGAVKSPPFKEGLGAVKSPFKEGLGAVKPAYKSISNLKEVKELRRNLRNNATPAEKILWKVLQGKQLDGFKFRRQHSIDRYILDFFCPSANLAIELDGETHYTSEAIEYDQIRDNFLANVGIKVIRYPNNEIFENLDGVLEDIRQHLLGEKTSSPIKVNSTTSDSTYIEVNSTTPDPSYIGGEKDSPLSRGVRAVNYILGNPPFVGKQLQNIQQKTDMNLVFNGVKNAGVLDYVCAWYLKAAQYLNPPLSPLKNGRDSLNYSPPFKEGLGEVKSPFKEELREVKSPFKEELREVKTRCAFVSTNSISQGEQVGILWQELYNKYNIKIHFAHRTFSWSNEAKGNAAVHCVIIGFGLENIDNKRLFSYENIKGEAIEIKAQNISPYLTIGRNIFILSRSSPICDVPSIKRGNSPYDDGNFLLNQTELENLLKLDSKAIKFIKKFIGAKEFINGENKYCIWLVNANPNEIKQCQLILERIEKVRQFRINAKGLETQKYSAFPSLFRDKNNPDTFIVIPRVSSENRKYIPMGFFDKNSIPGDTCMIIPNGDLFLFGILTSQMHMTWVKYICGRLKSDYRYSKDIVYNNYPFPENVTEKQRGKVANLAQKILDIRAKYPDSSLADLYDTLTMPPDLVKAHNNLDKAVDLCYRSQPFTNELNRMEFLFNLYENLNTPLLKIEKKKRNSKNNHL